MIKGTMIVICGALFVSGCSTYSLEELRHATPRGSAFQNILAKLYMDFSDLEEKKYDWQDSWYFADKGLLAVYGKDTVPEELANWNLPADELDVFKKSRADLIAVLTPEILKRKPETAARAQFYFDCWVEQQEENWQLEDIEYCRHEFVRALTKLDGGKHKISKKKFKKLFKKSSNKQSRKADKVITHKNHIGDIMPTIFSFMVGFEPNSTKFTPLADSVLADITKTIAMQGNTYYEVVISDKSAGKKNNLELSLERIQAVKIKLVEAGVKESSIENGIKKEKPINRRIEIFLND